MIPLTALFLWLWSYLFHVLVHEPDDQRAQVKVGRPVEGTLAVINTSAISGGEVVEQLATAGSAAPEVQAHTRAGEATAPPLAAHWSSAVIERLDTVDVDELTPMEALALVQELKQLREQEPDQRDDRRAMSGRS